MKIVNQDLWLGMSLASNGAKSFARIMLDFTILHPRAKIRQAKFYKFRYAHNLFSDAIDFLVEFFVTFKLFWKF
jgi:hypothetical protein